LEDHIEFREMFSSFDNSLYNKVKVKENNFTYLISDKNTAVELRSKVTDELFSTSHILVDKDMLELIYERFLE
jgi:hypothetical protein